MFPVPNTAAAMSCASSWKVVAATTRGIRRRQTTPRRALTDCDARPPATIPTAPAASPPAAATMLAGAQFAPVIAAVCTLVAVPLVAPPNPGCASFVECPYDLVWDYLLSLPLLGCMGAMFAGVAWAYGPQKVGTRLTQLQQLLMLWHLTNGTWWSFGCDVLSGLFAVTPLLNNTYLLIDSKHTLGPAFSEPRVNLDVVYLTELTLHVPVSLVVFYCYVKLDAARFIIEPLLGGAQIVGTIAYYLPEGIMGGHHWPYDRPLIWSLGIGLGVFWIVIPLALLWRGVGMARAMAAKLHKE